MYGMKEFSAMTGLSPSRVRFYEKQGLALSNRRKNGYRVFTPEDAFRSNAFRMFLQYGFSVEEAIRLLDTKQKTEEFEQLLLKRIEGLRQEADAIEYRLRRLVHAHEQLNSDKDFEFEEVDMPDQVFVRASIGRDFSISLTNEAALIEYYDLLTLTSCARVVSRDKLFDEGDAMDPSYVLTLPEYEKYRLSEEALTKTEYLRLGKCVRYDRQLTREKSAHKESYDPLLTYLERKGYKIRDDIMIFPSFFNLDGKGRDAEILYIPIS